MNIHEENLSNKMKKLIELLNNEIYQLKKQINEMK